MPTCLLPATAAFCPEEIAKRLDMIAHDDKTAVVTPEVPSDEAPAREVRAASPEEPMRRKQRPTEAIAAVPANLYALGVAKNTKRLMYLQSASALLQHQAVKRQASSQILAAMAMKG